MYVIFYGKFILAIFFGWAGVMLYKHYVSDVNDKRENDDYLRKLVRQVNDSPETTLKVSVFSITHFYHRNTSFFSQFNIPI